MLIDFILGKHYNYGQFCIDFFIDYCESPDAKLRVYINDEELYKQGITSIFGSTNPEGQKMKLFKKVGFCISIFFLLLTIAMHLAVDEVRSELGGKMVIAIASTMVGEYICLFILTFDGDDIVGNASKSSRNCIALGSIWLSKIKIYLLFLQSKICVLHNIIC